jgi:hypothetical protein
VKPTFKRLYEDAIMNKNKNALEERVEHHHNKGGLSRNLS